MKEKIVDDPASNFEQSSVHQWAALTDIALPARQPRQYFDPVKLEQLVESIKVYGVLENLIVRPLLNADKQYELVTGERRYKAASIVGLTQVPVTVRQLTDEQALSVALIENLQRSDLSPIEETEGILQLLSIQLNLKKDKVVALLYRIQHEQRGKVAHNIIGSPQFEQIETLFSKLGRFTWESFVVNRLPLLKLPAEMLELVRSGRLAYTKAQLLARVKNEELQATLLQEALEHNLSLSEIRKRIKGKTFNVSPESTSSQDALRQAYQRIRLSRVWEDPHKWKRVKELLQELKSLIEE
ncbi:MAG TPA: ParB/RepB/Spo0J family partition protein [Coleofasciculaceae cyanobacterium]